MEVELKNPLKIKIAEAYLKIKVDYNEENVEGIRKTLINVVENELLIRRRKQRIDNLDEPESNTDNKDNNFGIDYEVDALDYIISFDEGSTKARVTFFGVLLLIGQYGDIRSGLTYIKDDITSLCESVIERSSHLDATIGNNLERSERRTGVVGRILRTINRIKNLEDNLNGLSNSEIRDELGALRQELANALILLPEQDKNSIINSLSLSTRDNMPPPNPNEEQHFYNLYALKPEELI